MTVLVTGAGGFIGSHLVEALLRAGHKVRALVHYNSRGSWGHLGKAKPEFEERLEVCLGDVRDPHQIRDVVAGCEVVLHLAALIGIPYSYHAPASYVQTNIGGTLNILEACREAGVRRVVVTSSSEVYGSPCYTPIDESHPLQPQSPYAASKVAADKLAESYFRSYGVPAVIHRQFNMFGPRQSARAVAPTILAQAMAGVEEIHLGNLEARRDLTFIDDTVRAFLLTAEAPGIEGETIQFGRGSAVSIGELAEMCLKIVGSDARIVSVPERLRPESSEVELLLCDASKAERLLGWKAQVSLEEGLCRTAQYIQNHLDQYCVEAYVI
jgi:dTDP-glucose 4,6-dehydratase